MIAYKGFTKDLTATMGKGIYQFQPGETVEEERSKTRDSGFHCTENPFECLGYYGLGAGNRYFQVDAAGSIDEDDKERIACTRMTLVKELTVKELAGYGMMYMVRHPLRRDWKQSRHMIEVEEDVAQASRVGAIAIARGQNPKVRGAEGSILGLILEPEPGIITAARLFVAGCQSGTRADVWYTVTEHRNLKEVIVDETKGS